MPNSVMTTDEALDVLRQAITDACTWVGIAQNESPYRERALTAMSHLAAMADPERGRDQLADTQRAIIEAAERRGYGLAQADLQAEIDRLRSAGQRVTDAFRALGTAKPGVATSIKHHECEAAMLALDAAIAAGRGDDR